MEKKKILKGESLELWCLIMVYKIILKNKDKILRADVGDRYVKDKMQKYNFNLGGEQSGHIILGKFATTGDGLLVGMEVLFSMKKEKSFRNI